MSRLTIIVAATKTNGIGQNGRLPWRLPKEMAYFARVTTNAPVGSMNSVIMGRKSWESIPSKFRPLKERVNVIISRNEGYELFPTEVDNSSKAPKQLASSLTDAITHLSTHPSIHHNFIIGGSSIYKSALALTPSDTIYVDRVLLTRILEPEFGECDTFMPDFIAKEEEGRRWERKEHAELSTWVGFDVPEGVQEENGVKYEFQMWVR